MIAEAKVRNGEDGTDELNMIRNRVGMNFFSQLLGCHIGVCHNDIPVKLHRMWG